MGSGIFGCKNLSGRNLVLRIIATIVFFSITFSLMACSDTKKKILLETSDGQKPRLYILKNSSEHADTINEQIKRGVQAVSKEIGSLRIEFSEPIKNVDEAHIILKRFIASDANYILASDPSYYKIIEDAARENEKVKFAIIDSDKLPENISNLVNYRFKDVEIGFLMGVITSKIVDKGKSLFLGATNDFRTLSLLEGFMKAIEYTTSPLQYKVEYLGSSESAYENSELAHTISNNYYLNGYDVIVQGVGKASKGVFDSAVKNQKFVLGYGVDQTLDVGEYTKKIFLANVIKRYDSSAYEAIKNFTLQEFTSGSVLIGCKENAVDYILNEANDKILSIKAELEVIKKGIASEKIRMPRVKE